MNTTKETIHLLYNSLSKSNDIKLDDIKEVLLKVYMKVDPINDKKNESKINKLVNYIYFIGYTEKIHFSKYEEELIRNLNEVGKRAGLTGAYRSDYGDKSQF